MYPVIRIPPDKAPRPEYGRTRRFSEGQLVHVAHGGDKGHVGRIIEWKCDPHQKGYEHCGGNSAKYRVDGHEGWLYDWQLERKKRTFHHLLQCLFCRLLPCTPQP